VSPALLVLAAASAAQAHHSAPALFTVAVVWHPETTAITEAVFARIESWVLLLCAVVQMLAEFLMGVM
jgi:hypothetical protein